MNVIDQHKLVREFAIYLRKSRTDLELEKNGEDTLQHHEQRLKELAKKLKIVIPEENIFRELVSGESIGERPEMQKLLNGIMAKKYKGVLVVDLDRLARGNTKEQGMISEAFKLTDTQIITPNKIYNPNDISDEDFIDFGLFMARFEYKAITRRMKAGKKQTILNGNYVLPIAPFGYDIHKISKHNRTLKINEDAETVKQIFHWWNEDRLPQLEIARRLTMLKVKNKTWKKEVVRAILKNVTYTGKIKWETKKQETVFENGIAKKKRIKNENPIIVDGKHEAIISDEVFQKAQTLFITPRKNEKLKLVNPLAGLFRCKKCNAVLSLRKDTGKNKIKRFKHFYNHDCKLPTIKHDVVINAILSDIENQVKHLEVKIKNEKQNDNQIIINALKKELKELKEREDNLHDLLERKIYSEEKFLERNEKLQSEIAIVQNNLTNELQKQSVPIDHKEKIVTLKNVIEKLKDDNLDAETKNKFYKSIIEKITYNGDRIEIFYL